MYVYVEAGAWDMAHVGRQAVGPAVRQAGGTWNLSHLDRLGLVEGGTSIPPRAVFGASIATGPHGGKP